METVLEFLRDLAANNNREWFQDNRKRYEESRDKVLFATEVLIQEIGRFDSSVRGLDPRDCVFRIFRDVRFSNDKRPYKTNFGSFICAGGRKSMNPGYYFHIEPGNSFAGGGIYRPASDRLKAIRTFLTENADEFYSIVNAPEFKDDFPALHDDCLKTVPRGFAKDHPHAGLLKYKSFVFSQSISDRTVAGGNFLEILEKLFEKVSPVNRLLYEALV